MPRRQRASVRRPLLLGMCVSGAHAWSPAAAAPAVHSAATRWARVADSQLKLQLTPPAMTSPRLLTEALFWTESHYDQEEARWFGRVKGLAAKPNALKTP